MERVNDKKSPRGGIAAAEDPAWQQRVGVCSLIVAFYAAHAAGNAPVGDTLMKTGTLRAACAIFTAGPGPSTKDAASVYGYTGTL